LSAQVKIIPPEAKISVYPDLSGEVIIVISQERKKIEELLKLGKSLVISREKEFSPTELKKAFKEYNFRCEETGGEKALQGLFTWYNSTVDWPNPVGLPKHEERIHWILGGCKGASSILDIGCGAGFVASLFRNTISLEISKFQLKMNKALGEGKVQALGEFLPFKDETFEVVVLANVLQTVLNPQVVLREARRVISKTGKLLITVPDESKGYSEIDIKNLHHFSKEDLGQLIKSLDLEGYFEEITVGPFSFNLIEVRKRNDN